MTPDELGGEPAIRRWWAEIRRTITIAFVFARAVAGALLVRLRSRFRTPRSHAFAEATATAFEDLGPTFVKIGQLITSSPGIFPAPLVDACRRHLYASRPVPADLIRAVIEDDLGAPVDALFQSFDDVPLASASVAQVHGCTLRDGTPAVIKVQRPGIAVGMITDLGILARLARLVDRIPAARSANLPGIVDDLRAVTVRELDLRHEAIVQRRFGENLHAFGDNTVMTVPTIHEELCGPRTITMERLFGVPLNEYVDRAPDRFEGEVVLRRIFKAWLEAVMVHGPFHADVHAGNIWVLDDGRLAFLDFGISGELPPAWRDVVANLFLGTAFDAGFEPLAASTKLVGAIPEAAGSDADVAASLEALVVPLLVGDPDDIAMGDLLSSLVEAFGQFGVKVPNELVLVAKQLLYLEGYTAALSPDHHLATDLYLLRNIHPDLVRDRIAAGTAGVDFPD